MKLPVDPLGGFWTPPLHNNTPTYHAHLRTTLTDLNAQEPAQEERAGMGVSE